MEDYLSNRNKNEAEIIDFKNAAENLANLLSSNGRTVCAWNNESIEKLKSKSVSEIKLQTKKLQFCFNIYQSAIEENIDPRMESKILWRLLAKEGWSFSSDLFGEISDNDIIEIYLCNGSQYFANSVFMDLCSYDLSDIASYRWDELFTRDKGATEAILSNVRQVMEKPEKRLYYFDIPKHRGAEVFSMDRIELEMKLKVFCPLFDEKKEMVAFLTTFEARKVLPSRDH
jgi:hypothetical protein